MNGEEIFNELTHVSDYWDGEHLSFRADRLRFCLDEIAKKDLWAECVAMADKQDTLISYHKDYYVVWPKDFDRIGPFTLPELHAKLTELTKG